MASAFDRLDNHFDRQFHRPRDKHPPTYQEQGRLSLRLGRLDYVAEAVATTLLNSPCAYLDDKEWIQEHEEH